MQFFPYNIPVTSVATAISASSSPTASFLANFAAVSVNVVNTASLALNITGSKGEDGTGAVVPGPKGPTGDRGVTGPRGDSVYLLSSSWYDGSPCTAPETCVGYGFTSAYQDSFTFTWICTSQIVATYRSTDTVLLQGSAMFSDTSCVNPLPDTPVIGAYSGTVYGVYDGFLTFVGTCGQTGV